MRKTAELPKVDPKVCSVFFMKGGTDMSRVAVLGEMDRDVKDLLIALHGMSTETEECLDVLQTSFLYSSKQHGEECRRKLSHIKKTGNVVERAITDRAKEHNVLNPYISVSGWLMTIAGNIEKFADLNDKKIKDGLLFSDKAVEEVTFLLQRLIDIMKPASDIILARNEILSNYVQESEGDIMRKALEYSTLHEERLIEGICHPVASTVYVNMLDAIKSIAWHAKQIAIKLAE